MESSSDSDDYYGNGVSAALFGSGSEYEFTENIEDDDEEEDEDDEENVPADPSPRVSQEGARDPSSDEAIDEPQSFVEEDGNKRRRIEAKEASCSFDSQENVWNRTDIDGLFCPICMDAWTDNGDHHICCLPCGHVFGMSCIKKWLQLRNSSGKCPQCNGKCSLNDVRKLYASRLVAVDEESQKRIRSLEARCAALESKEQLDLHALGISSTSASSIKTELNEIKSGLQATNARITVLEEQVAILFQRVNELRDSSMLEVARSSGSDEPQNGPPSSAS